MKYPPTKDKKYFPTPSGKTLNKFKAAFALSSSNTKTFFDKEIAPFIIKNQPEQNTPNINKTVIEAIKNFKVGSTLFLVYKEYKSSNFINIFNGLVKILL